MKKEILTTFSNGGQLIKMHPLQLQFLEGVSHRELKDAIKLGVISTDISLPDSMKELSHIIYMKRYNSGKQAKYLNEILYGIKKYRKLMRYCTVLKNIENLPYKQWMVSPKKIM